MDVDVFVASHRGEWQRLEQLLSKAHRPRHLSGHEVDELVELYQRTTTHLSMLQSAGRDAVLLGRLSALVAQARNVISGTRQAAWKDAARFLKADFPAILYRTRWWWGAAAVASLLVMLGWAVFLINHPAAQAALITPDRVDKLVNHEFRDYYSSAPGQDFAAHVWTNNALIAAGAVASGLLLGLPIFPMLYSNSLNVGIVAALMISHHKGSVFFGLILPHGMLELTSVFVAAGLGLKLGWTVIDPGPRTRGQAIGEEGRALVSGAVGLTLMLFVSGLIEAFVTPSGLPTWARIGIGALAEVAFFLWVFVLGKRAFRAGVTGDLDEQLRAATVPVSA